jgi:hypothetical protein
MSANKLAFCAALASALALGASSVPARAAEVGTYFPLPNYFPITGSAKDSLLKIQKTWLTDGLAKLKKARDEASAALEKAKADGSGQVAALEEKLNGLEKQVADVTKELEVANDDTVTREIQVERKRLFLLNVNRWINALNRAATEQMKIAIMKDGAEAMTGERLAAHYSQQADDIERAKHDPSIENWGNK